MELGAGRPVCVIGAGGFIASWLVAKLLAKGYHVRGTVRNPDNCEHLKQLEGSNERLTLLRADILDYDSLLPAVRGCDGVFHTACPVKFAFDNADDVLGPAIAGTRNVLLACSNENISRVVVTSSGAAIVGSPHDGLVDESCWTDTDYAKEKKMWYVLAKTEAEKLAWQMSKEYNLDLVVVCPTFVFGPMLQPTLNTTSQLLKNIGDGSMESAPNRILQVVDVRDVAQVHILAYETPEACGRYYCFGTSIGYKEIVEIVKKHFPQLPGPAKFAPGALEGLPADRVSNKKTRELIQEFIPIDKTLVDAFQSFDAARLLSK